MHFNELLRTFPETLSDRLNLCCAPGADDAPDLLAQRFGRNGVLLFRNVLPPQLVSSAREHFLAFGASLGSLAESPREGRDIAAAYREGNGNYPWEPRIERAYPLAPIIPALIRSWIWPTIEAICRSTNIVILLSLCTARHIIDNHMGVGAHQDAVAVTDLVPFSIWIPLQDISPGVCSGLGFVVPRPDAILPQTNNDVGESYFLNHVQNVWMPSYLVGDLSIHDKLTPHFTTGFGTKTERFSVEIRCMSMETAPPALQDPAMYVARRDGGEPVIVKSRASEGNMANGYLSSPDAAGTPMRREYRSPPWVYREY